MRERPPKTVPAIAALGLVVVLALVSWALVIAVIALIMEFD